MDDPGEPQSQPSTSPPGRLARLFRGEVSTPVLVLLLVVLAALVLGAASITGWTAIVLVVVVMAGFIALLFSWVAAG